jgi:hypothetical protein
MSAIPNKQNFVDCTVHTVLTCHVRTADMEDDRTETWQGDVDC